MQQAAAQDSGSGMYGIYGTQLQQHQQMQPGWGQGWGMPMMLQPGQPTTVMQPGATVSKPARPGGGFDPPPPPRITEFYHGTSVEAAMSIQAAGFDVSRTGSNAGAMLGVQRGTVGQPEGLKREPSSNLCVICLDEKATHAIVPCGHQCLCPDCAGFVDKCPMCRGAKENVIKIFR